MFPTRGWKPGKDEPGGEGGDAHAQRKGAAWRGGGELEVGSWQLGLEKWLYL